MSRQPQSPLPRASVWETVSTTVTALLPMLAQGVIARRPKMVSLAGKFEADRKTVRLLQRLRARHGSGPLRLRVPGRSVALVLSSGDVDRILNGSPETYAMSTVEKRGALTHFQPHGVLVSEGSTRGDRRRFNEDVLATGKPVHTLSEQIVDKVNEEARVVLDEAAASGTLTWNDFSTGWRRSIRRVVLGDSARDDEEVSSLLTSLRYDANWAYLRPKRDYLRRDLRQRLQDYVDAAEPGSLVGSMSEATVTAETDPVDQIPQWLFASDPAGMAAYRALALLATHPRQATEVREELAERDLATPQDLPLLRSSVVESVRLWPTTAVVLRKNTVETSLGSGVSVPRDTTLLILSSFFHRDDETVPQANVFDPKSWLDGDAPENWSLFPFSGGPGRCPGRELVLFVTSTFLAALLGKYEFRRHGPELLDPTVRLPCNVDPFAQSFSVRPRA